MWLPAPLYALVRRAVPIACVDVLPLRVGAAETELGLIRRIGEDGHSTGWALVGGRVLVGETLAEALDRHLRTTLGPQASWTLPAPNEAVYVAEYARHPRTGQLLDPRQHSIASTYVVPVDGRIEPRGEATDFRWFPVRERPTGPEVTFGQSVVIEALVRRDPRLSAALG